ncbi:MAG: helix-turn-helix domain-containing protein [Ruminococcus sp.]|nr:helix-turn-helix domain-containing protein [Ruminococcus sp.]
MPVQLKMLIINNDISAVSKYRRMPIWRENGFEISAVTSDINEAVTLMHKENIAFALIFNKPPAVDAAQILRLIASKNIKCETLVISPYGNTENMRECFIAGAVDYLCEPVPEAKIKDALLRAKSQFDKNMENHEYRIAAKEFFSSLKIQDKFSDSLLEFILKSEGVTVTTEMAADYFGFNKDYFGRLFKSRIGMTFGSFYKQFRILYAEKLLKSGRYRVYEVSELLGFSSVDYFTSVFKKQTGKRPSELKR